jgi:hypothetical protein
MSKFDPTAFKEDADSGSNPPTMLSKPFESENNVLIISVSIGNPFSGSEVITRSINDLGAIFADRDHSFVQISVDEIPKIRPVIQSVSNAGRRIFFLLTDDEQGAFRDLLTNNVRFATMEAIARELGLEVPEPDRTTLDDPPTEPSEIEE